MEFLIDAIYTPKTPASQISDTDVFTEYFGCNFVPTDEKEIKHRHKRGHWGKHKQLWEKAMMKVQRWD
jgi:hypothetical protein